MPWNNIFLTPVKDAFFADLIKSWGIWRLMHFHSESLQSDAHASKWYPHL